VPAREFLWPGLRRQGGEPDPKVIAALARQVTLAHLPAGRVPAGPRGQAEPAGKDWLRSMGRRRL
jgi:hypothetical protein